MKNIDAIRNSGNRSFWRHGSVFIPLGLVALLAVSPTSRAVVPAPDGGYPGFNTAEGQNALFSRTTGVANTGVGWYSLWSNIDGSYNTGLGAGTLLFNTADENTATGAGALLNNSTGQHNTANGALALLNNTTGSNNTATGHNALSSNTTGAANTANGNLALLSNTIGIENTANGGSALQSNTEGSDNTASGLYALGNNTTGSSNTAFGRSAGTSVTTADNVICIGASGANVSDSCFIGNIFGKTSASGAAVYINSSNKLGTLTSSSRFKDHIKPMERLSEALFALKPVSFHYKKEIDPAGMQQFGLVAEEVEKVNPDLVVRDKEGKPYSVRYDQVNAMLLNEFLKEHRKVRELEKRVEKLTAGLQKVSDHLELSKAAPRMVVNNQ
jgi:hypothetical protein